MVGKCISHQFPAEYSPASILFTDALCSWFSSYFFARSLYGRSFILVSLSTIHTNVSKIIKLIIHNSILHFNNLRHSVINQIVQVHNSLVHFQYTTYPFLFFSEILSSRNLVPLSFFLDFLGALSSPSSSSFPECPISCYTLV